MNNDICKKKKIKNQNICQNTAATLTVNGLAVQPSLQW